MPQNSFTSSGYYRIVLVASSHSGLSMAALEPLESLLLAKTTFGKGFLAGTRLLGAGLFSEAGFCRVPERIPFGICIPSTFTLG